MEQEIVFVGVSVLNWQIRLNVLAKAMFSFFSTSRTDFYISYFSKLDMICECIFENVKDRLWSYKNSKSKVLIKENYIQKRLKK